MFTRSGVLNWLEKRSSKCFRVTAIAFAGIVFLVGAEQAIGQEPRALSKPNIIFIMVDDLGYHDLGCYGSEMILTPNIDKMVAEGMRFTDCYSGAPNCAPARSTLMTGYHKGHTPVRSNSGGVPLFPEDVTVAEVLKKAGYATGGFGKWGLGNQGRDGAAERQGFDLFFGYYNQWHAHTYYTHLYRNSEKVDLHEPYRHYAFSANRGKVEKDSRYTHHAIFDETVKFIKENKDRPFFCYAPCGRDSHPVKGAGDRREDGCLLHLGQRSRQTVSQWDVDNGYWPRCFRRDSIHFNMGGAEYLSHLLAARIKELGW